MQTPWHGDYYQPEWGAPVALVVPPTAGFQTNYSWGVPASRITPIDHQFSRNYYGTGYGGFGTLVAPPFQPSDTNQFGVYYVRRTMVEGLRLQTTGQRLKTTGQRLKTTGQRLKMRACRPVLL